MFSLVFWTSYLAWTGKDQSSLMYVRRVTEIELVQHDEDEATGPAGTYDAIAPGL
jgi:hypothetical protein